MFTMIGYGMRDKRDNAGHKKHCPAGQRQGDRDGTGHHPKGVSHCPALPRIFCPTQFFGEPGDEKQ
jgi:hypothetical protein